MGCKAEGAAQGFTILGGIVLAIFAVNYLVSGLNWLTVDPANAALDIVLALVLILMVILAFDASGYIYWKVKRNGLLLAIFGFISIIIVQRGVGFDVIGWLTNVGTLAGLMLLIAGLLIIFKGT